METWKIYWNGPFDPNEVKYRNHIAKEFKLDPKNDERKILEKEGEVDWGIYQIYGVHPIFGDNTLLYIGIAQKRGFVERIGDHIKEWLLDEIDNCQIYLGKFFDENIYNTITNKEWNERISEAEKLLIHFCSPPYNSQNIQTLENDKEFILLNYGKAKRVPPVLSTLWTKEKPKPDDLKYFIYDANR